jgi:Na+-transporting NADH:ubiquinone oxidoreductase subunit A
MSKVIKIKRGLDIKLKGSAEKIISTAQPTNTYAVKPPDFPGITPRITAKPGEKVKAGTTLFYDKKQVEVKFSSPVSGVVKAVNRGERRRILEVVVETNGDIQYEDFKAGDPETMDREEIVKKIQDAGLWPAIRQRPYSVIARINKTPRDIFISGFDTAPLAPDMDYMLKGQAREFQTGINALKKLTTGKIHISLNALYPPTDTFTQAKGVELHYFKGPHPAGNPGVQINRICPVNKDETVWVIQPQDVIVIGRLFEKGIYDASRIIAITGSEVLKPRYYNVIGGTSIEPFVKGNVNPGEHRYISGNVLTGARTNKVGYLGFYDSQVTVIPEGNYYEMFGWALPGFRKFSVSRSFWSWLPGQKKYTIDTNIKGGLRPFVVTGEYEKVLPMDIYPMQLMKAILVEDIEKMEQLGIYEVAEEDFALCEFICSSKIDIQSIIRQGMDLMMKELE